MERGINMNKKGMTLIEIIVSLALISIVIVFLLNLFLNVRGFYNNSKTDADYELLVSNIVSAVSEDISMYGLESIEEITSVDSHKAYLLTFHTYRPTKLSKKIQKVLEVYPEVEEGTIRYYISYTYNTKYEQPPEFYKSTDIVSDERLTNIKRVVPKDALLDSTRYIHINEIRDKNNKRIIEIKIPISKPNGTLYDINIYGILT